MGQVPVIDSDDEELLALGDALERATGEKNRGKQASNKRQKVNLDDLQGENLDINEFSQSAGGMGMGGHATNLDGLDKDQIMKMIDQEVDGYEFGEDGDMDGQIGDLENENWQDDLPREDGDPDSNSDD